MSRLKLLYLFPEPLPLPKARGIQVINTLHALAGFPVDVMLAFVPVSGAPDPFAAYGLARPANINLLPLSRGLPWPFGGLKVQSGKLFQHRLAAWLRRARLCDSLPDVVMVRHVKQAKRLLAARLDVPIVYEAHEIFADEGPSRKMRHLAKDEREVLRRSAGVIAITRQLAELLTERYGLRRNIEIVPSATALPLVDMEKEWGVARRNIIYTGSLYGWKGAEDLAAAAQYLPGFKITFVGGDAAGIEALRKRLAPGGAEVEFVGQVSHAEVASRLARACIAVIPNRAGSVSRFTSPLKLFESMAAGCAIVASDLPVLREVLAPDDAAWFAAGDPRSLAFAIEQLALDQERAATLGRKMRELARDYTWTERARRLMAVFCETRERQQEKG